jgi:hypothetical protein
MKKEDFLKIVRENQNVGDVLKAISDPKTIQAADQTIDKLNTISQKMKDMGLVDESLLEMLDLSKDYKDESQFFRDMIDKLMAKIFGITYFETYDNLEYDALSKMGNKKLNDVLNNFMNKDGFMVYYNLIKQAKNVEGLKSVYLRLQDLIREPKKIKENLVNNPIFTILAEAEAPKISKAEILELINKK